MIYSKPVAYLNAREEAAFMSAIDSPKYKFLAYLMCDVGLRVSAAVSLKIKDFNFQKAVVMVRELKKRGNGKISELPLTRRIIEAASEYWKTVRDKHPNSFMFPTVQGEEGTHLDRKQVWRYFKSKGGVNPHRLRHTCATKLIENGTELHVVKEMLQHSDSRVTQGYIHASEERKRAAARKLEHTGLIQRIRERLFPNKAIHILPVSVGENKFHIGRKAEMLKIAEWHEKRVNGLILAPQGMGKSHLLDNFQADNLLRIDDCKEFKKTLANMVLHLSALKPEIVEMLNLEMPEVITRLSVKRTIEILKQLTSKFEFTLIFDSVDDLTPASIKALEALRGHFHIIASARSVAIKNASWLTNFEQIRLGPLRRAESLELIERIAEDFRGQIEDIAAFKNHIYESTNGVPLFITEMVQRFRVQKFVRADDIAAIGHSAARSEISAIPILLALIGCIVIGKFYGKEAMPDDKEAFMLFGGVAMVVLIFGRMIFTSTKRRFV
jgi:integrase/recombinase XerD